MPRVHGEYPSHVSTLVARLISICHQPDTIWRNRGQFMKGREEVIEFLTRKWEKENGYRLRKDLFAFTDNKIAVQVCMTLV